MLLCAVALLNAACSQDEADEPTLAVVGDSITVLQRQWGALDAHLADEYSVAVAATSGQRIDQMQPELAALLDAPEGAPERVVINLGTNDMAQDYPQWERSFDEMWATVADRSCVVYVTVREVSDRALGPLINEKIRDVEAAYTNVRVFDWNAYVSERSTADRPLLFDPVHPTREGADALAAGTQEALDSCPEDG
jgi:lysophospholipase L1-like esterase